MQERQPRTTCLVAGKRLPQSGCTTNVEEEMETESATDCSGRFAHRQNILFQSSGGNSTHRTSGQAAESFYSSEPYPLHRRCPRTRKRMRTLRELDVSCLIADAPTWHWQTGRLPNLSARARNSRGHRGNSILLLWNGMSAQVNSSASVWKFQHNWYWDESQINLQMSVDHSASRQYNFQKIRIDGIVWMTLVC